MRGSSGGVFLEESENYALEHLIIDNASQDQTVPIIEEISKTKKHIKLIVNSRNFGLITSPYYGILQSTGDAVIPIMADMQTPLETIPKFIDEWEKGAEIVFELGLLLQKKCLEALTKCLLSVNEVSVRA